MKIEPLPNESVPEYIKRVITNKNIILVKQGEYKVSSRKNYYLKTLALGSCVAVICYDPKNKVGGMVHIVRPDSNQKKDINKYGIGYFADTGISAMLNNMKHKGADINKIKIKITGGSQVLKTKGDVGAENIEAVKKTIKNYGLEIKAEDTGGNIPRTVALFIDTGEVIVSTNNNKKMWIL